MTTNKAAVSPAKNRRARNLRIGKKKRTNLLNILVELFFFIFITSSDPRAQAGCVLLIRSVEEEIDDVPHLRG
jgi:hypothetical protein